MEVLENLAFLANGSNLVLYFREFMHFSPSNSSNSVTNFMGTAFLLALLGGFLCDAFYTTYFIFIFSAFVELVVSINIIYLIFFFIIINIIRTESLTYKLETVNVKKKKKKSHVVMRHTF